MNKTGVVFDPFYQEHLTGEYHPESPKRLEVLYNMLKDDDISGKFLEIKPRYCDRKDLEMIHHPDYISMVERTSGMPRYSLDPDTQTSPYSYKVAKLAVGGVFEAIDYVIGGKCKNAFAMIRPPGHHAEASRAMGFCLFNNIALGARYAQNYHSIKRVLIIDWDLHHGNGTQKAFYDDPSILYFSTHQYPYYPGSGHYKEIGKGKGTGYTINIPLGTGNGNSEYIEIFKKLIFPISVSFNPEIVLVSAGFDIYYKDPLGGMKVTKEGFAFLTRIIMDIAERCCNGKMIVILEGGYHLEGLRESAKEVLKELMGINTISQNYIERISKPNPLVNSIIENVKEEIKPYWKGVLDENR
jgi:acetoin utilization deacetylase AcuC-like enzyme